MGRQRQFGGCGGLTAAFFCASLSLSCSGGTAVGTGGGDTVVFRHARLLTVVDYGDCRRVDIADPWNTGRVLHSYILAPDGSDMEEPQGATLIRVPVARAVSFTTVHASLLSQLGATPALVGIADGEYLKTPSLRQLYDGGVIADVGNAASPDVERIVDLAPGAILASPFENSGGYGALADADIPIVECADYMEPSPLARAEWMRFYGMLFGVEQGADSLFAVVERRYEALRADAKLYGSRPLVMVDKPMTSGVWYMPGGESTMGRIIADANARYCLADVCKSGSVALSVETAVERCGDADVWIFRYGGADASYESLSDETGAFACLKAFRERRVYGCSTERTLFYEETPFRPDLLLAELITVFHPEAPKGEARYFFPVR